jgi:hypothetical protein
MRVKGLLALYVASEAVVVQGVDPSSLYPHNVLHNVLHVHKSSVKEHITSKAHVNSSCMSHHGRGKETQ